MLRPLAALALGSLALLALSDVARGQGARPFAVSVQGRYSAGLALRDSLARAAGPGAALRLDVRPDARFGAALVVGYDRLSLRHPEGAQVLCYATVTPCARSMPRTYTVEEWGWAHWERLYRNEVKVLTSNYAATLTPVQGADVYSAALLPAARLRVGRFSAAAEAGPSVLYGRRTLYMDEQWTKSFPQGDSATFSYRFRNNAPDKTGWALGLDAGMSGRLRLTRVLDAVGAVRYRQLLTRRAYTDNGVGEVRIEDDGALPFGDFLGFELGLSVR